MMFRNRVEMKALAVASQGDTNKEGRSKGTEV